MCLQAIVIVPELAHYISYDEPDPSLESDYEIAGALFLEVT